MNNNIHIIPERNVNETKGMGRCSYNDFVTMVMNNCCARIVFADGKAGIITVRPVSDKKINGGRNE